MSWRVARSLDTLLAEINERAPHRDKAADGSIGDTSHQARPSDHNPNAAGVVRARDFTHDPNDGLDCNALARYLADLLGEHPALASGAYVIWNHRIISRDRISEGWRAYTGSNPHDHHLHLSVATAATGYDSTAAWGWNKGDDDVTPEDIDKIAAAVEKRLTPVIKAEVARQFGDLFPKRDLDVNVRAAIRELVQESRKGAGNAGRNRRQE